MSLEIILKDAVVSRAGRRLLDRVSWRLAPGARHLLTGDNGAGKSTLLALARGEIWPDQLPGGGFAGERTYIVDGHATMSPIPARARIRMAGAGLRDRYRAMGWNVSAWLVVVSGLTDSPLPSGRMGQAEEAAAREALADLGLERLAGRPFLELSQGQAMGVLLARALVAPPLGAPGRAPEWLFLDEAADGLDATSRRTLLDSLERLGARGLGVVLASHHDPGLEGCETLHLEQGRVVALPAVSSHGAHGPDASSADAAHGSASDPASAPAPIPCGPGGPEPVAVRPGHARPAPVLELQDASLVLSGREALSGVSWSVRPGEHWLVRGPNGAGKSSLLKLLGGDLYPTSGAVRRFGLPEHASLWDLRERMGLVSWEGQAQWPEGFSVEDALVSGFFGSHGLYDRPTPTMLQAARAWMERLGLAALAGRPMSTLSQGQARRAMIGRALAFDPPMLLLDEPLGGLDRRARRRVLDLMDALAAEGRQIVMVTHNAREVPRCITHVLTLERGRVVSAGPLAP
ncbi:putative ABC transporter ATP-binding protein YlmA [Fundidesulfovibrio magnetotacticus]|uniref:Putative ABC transporter ATP-binding protein YlmA n=1 Tax=Fundidesulfovibrio magnetotacticus TaxID=2730080 RepID=A0A6V8LSY6_9BACT|nr:ATP-binding cassette domain-containing protein [Fundidesulfovibrio magnetotacticus]GFK94070.1 putative ABC transporter ATP-binding protein YlmA [Fundidesulfovibrio magnetotacticus]